MHRAIGPLVHGILDFATVIILLVGPSVVGFGGKQALFCYVLAVVHLLLTVVTRFPFGLFKVVGLPIHGAIELIVGVLLVILPWIADFARGVLSRNFFVCIGLLILAIWAMTDYRNIRGVKPAIPPSTGP